MLKYGLTWYYHRINKNTATGKFFLCIKKNHPTCTFAILRFKTFSGHSYSLSILKIISDNIVERF